MLCQQNLGNDTLNGGDGNDSLYGNAGIDIYDSGAGIDRIAYVATALASSDLETGGSDIAISSTGDHIDFTSAIENLLQLGGINLSALATNTVVGATIDATNELAFTGGFLQIDLNADGAFNAAQDFQISLAGVASVTYNALGDYFTLA